MEPLRYVLLEIKWLLCSGDNGLDVVRRQVFAVPFLELATERLIILPMFTDISLYSVFRVLS